MAIMREYECKAHGVWTTDSKIVEACPAGCKSFQRVFLQPPGYMGVRTKNHDRMSRDIAQSFGLTDMSNRNGDSVMANQLKKYPATAQSFALKPGTPGSKVSVKEAMEGSGLFVNSTPSGIVQNSFDTGRGAVAGSLRRDTSIVAASDRNGNLIRPGR